MQRQPSFEKVYAYFILSARILLAYMFLHYGVGKLTGSQLGVSKETLELPLKNIDPMRLSWHLGSFEPFKSFIGISQIITGSLLIFRRTALVGAFISIPIWLNILIWDMTFIGTFSPFTFRISFYLLLTVFIIFSYRKKLKELFMILVKPDKFTHGLPLWLLILAPLGAVALEFVIGMLMAALRLTVF